MEAFDIETLSVDQVRALYHSRLPADFPPDEVKPLSAILRAMARGEYICYGAVRDGEILAYAFFVTLNRANGRWAMADYLAVREDLRNRGLGSRFLQALIDRPLAGADCALLETEDPDSVSDARQLALRRRRLSFYLRNRLADTQVTASVFRVDYRILALPVGPTPTPEKTRRVYGAIYRAMLPEKLFDAMVEIR